ncbi:MAG: hypothetical protein ACI855_004301, partial [Myxococcota bacterium]
MRRIRVGLRARSAEHPSGLLVKLEALGQQVNGDFVIRVVGNGKSSASR